MSCTYSWPIARATGCASRRAAPCAACRPPPPNRRRSCVVSYRLNPFRMFIIDRRVLGERFVVGNEGLGACGVGFGDLKLDFDAGEARLAGLVAAFNFTMNALVHQGVLDDFRF